MLCDEFEGLISDYLEDNVSYTQLEEILVHLDECEDCRNELELNYIIKYGFSDDYSENDYDFINMISQDIDTKREYVEHIKARMFMRKFVWLGVNFIMILCTIYLFL